MSYKKYLVAVFSLAILALPLFSLAQTVGTGNEALQAQIQELLNQVQTLQTQLNQVPQNELPRTIPSSIVQSASSMAELQFCYDFTANLKVGNRGEGVVALQKILDDQGFTIPENELKSKTFAEGTARAVRDFQETYASEILTPVGLSVGSGFVGKNTRVLLNRLSSCKTTDLKGVSPLGVSLTDPQISSERYQIPGVPVALSTSTPSFGIIVEKNTAYANPAFGVGHQNAKIGSYSFTAYPTEGVSLVSVTISTGGGSSNFKNLKLKDGGTQIGLTYPTLSHSANYAFVGNSAVIIPAGKTKVLDIYADVFSGAPLGTYSSITILNGCTGTTAIRGLLITCGVTFGQDVSTVLPTLTVSLDSSSPPASQVVMGSINNNLAVFRFSETSNIEDTQITDLVVTQQVPNTATKVSFTNLGLYNASSLVGTAFSSVINNAYPFPFYRWNFHFVNPVVVSHAGSISLVLKGDVASYASSGATDNTAHVFKIASTTDVTALGSTSNMRARVSLGLPVSYPVVVLRTKPPVSAAFPETIIGHMPMQQILASTKSLFQEKLDEINKNLQELIRQLQLLR